MPTTTNYGFYSPPLTGVTPNVPRDTQTLANAVDVALKAEETARIAADAINDYSERFQGSAQSIPNNAITAIDMDTSVTATGITWDSSTKEFVIVRAGRYQVNASVSWVANATGLRLGYILINGANRLRQTGVAGASAATTIPLCKGFSLATGDRIRISGFQTSGGSLNTDQSNRQTHADVSWMGPA